MLKVHMFAPMRLAHAALPGMIGRESGGIVNVASLAAFLALPGNANYCATKAYLLGFLADAGGRGAAARGATCRRFARVSPSLSFTTAPTGSAPTGSAPTAAASRISCGELHPQS